MKKDKYIEVRVINNKRWQEGTLGVLKVVREKHKLYNKIVNKRKKMMVHHDSKSFVEIGNKILIQECRPISKTKRYKTVEVTSC